MDKELMSWITVNSESKEARMIMFELIFRLIELGEVWFDPEARHLYWTESGGIVGEI